MMKPSDRLGRFGLLLLVSALLSCATARVRPTATLRVICSVPEATLWIDDHLVGRVGEWKDGQPVAAGFRRVEIRHPSYFTFFAELAPQQNEGVILNAELRPQLD